MGECKILTGGLGGQRLFLGSPTTTIPAAIHAAFPHGCPVVSNWGRPTWLSSGCMRPCYGGTGPVIPGVSALPRGVQGYELITSGRTQSCQRCCWSGPPVSAHKQLSASRSCVDESCGSPKVGPAVLGSCAAPLSVLFPSSTSLSSLASCSRVFSRLLGWKKWRLVDILLQTPWCPASNLTLPPPLSILIPGTGDCFFQLGVKEAPGILSGAPGLSWPAGGEQKDSGGGGGSLLLSQQYSIGGVGLDCLGGGDGRPPFLGRRSEAASEGDARSLDI